MHNPYQLPENPLIALENICAFTSRDMGANRRDAWLYGIVMGWSDYDDPDAPEESAMQELALKHSWSPEVVARLKRLHQAFVVLRDSFVDPRDVVNEQTNA
jgi:hypothetical protein